RYLASMQTDRGMSQPRAASALASPDVASALLARAVHWVPASLSRFEASPAGSQAPLVHTWAHARVRRVHWQLKLTHFASVKNASVVAPSHMGAGSGQFFSTVAGS